MIKSSLYHHFSVAAMFHPLDGQFLHSYWSLYKGQIGYVPLLTVLRIAAGSKDCTDGFILSIDGLLGALPVRSILPDSISPVHLDASHIG